MLPNYSLPLPLGQGSRESTLRVAPKRLSPSDPGLINQPVGKMIESASMSKKLHLTVITLTLSLAKCSQPNASATSAPTNAQTITPTPAPTAIPAPTQTPTSKNTPTPISAEPDNSAQVGMYRLIPPGFLSAGYCDVKQVREHPELKSVFEAVSGGCALSGEPDEVDALMGIGVLPSAAGSSGITLPIATIRRGYFDREAMAEQLQEDFAGALHQDYQGIELAVFGSVKIVGDTFTQEGRFVKVEGVLPIEDLPQMFE